MFRTIPTFISAIVIAAILSGCDTSSNDMYEARQLAAEAAGQNAAYLVLLEENDQQAAQESYAASRELYRRAIIAYQQARADVSGNPDRVQEFGEIAEKAGEYDLAARAYRRLTELQPEQWDWKLRAGHLYRLTGDAYHDDALYFLQTCAKAEAAPDEIRADAYVELGKLYWSLGLFENAKDFFTSAQNLVPEHTVARIGLAAVAVRDGDMLTGSAMLDALTDLTDVETSILNFLIDQGLSGFSDSRSVFPDTAEQHYAYARLLVQVGNYYEAMLALERSLELNNDNYPAYNLLGGVLTQLGEPNRAGTAYEASLKLNPNQPRTLELIRQLASGGADK